MARQRRSLPRRLRLGAPEPAFSWAGFYVGGNFGNGFGVGSPLSGFGTDASLRPTEFWSYSGANPGGLIGGLQAEHNWQFGNIVAGIEADMETIAESSRNRTLIEKLTPIMAVRKRRIMRWLRAATAPIPPAPS